MGPGQEDNAQANDGGQLPDLKESFVFGPPEPPRDARAQADPQWYVDNRLPEGPGGAALGAALDALFHACIDVSARLVAVAERAPGAPTGSMRARGAVTTSARWSRTTTPAGGVVVRSRGVAHRAAH